MTLEGKHPYGGFLKWWYPTTMGFPTKNDHFGVFWGYHQLRKHPYIHIFCIRTKKRGSAHQDAGLEYDFFTWNSAISTLEKRRRWQVRTVKRTRKKGVMNWVFPKMVGNPQIIHFNRVFHYFHHPFWGTSIFGNTQLFAKSRRNGSLTWLFHVIIF